MKQEEFFLGQSPLPTDNSKLRVIKVVKLKQSSFAYDMWEWKLNPSNKTYELSSLYHEGVRQYLKSKGYYKRVIDKNNYILVREENNVIEEVSEEDIKNALKSYVFSFEKNIEFMYGETKYSIPIEAIRNIYLKQIHNIANSTWLACLDIHETEILKDTKTKSYLVFRNCYVEVTKNAITSKSLSKLLNVCVWKNQIINHDFLYVKERELSHGEYEKFIKNLCNLSSERAKSLQSAIGYLLHVYFDPTKGQAVLIYDEKSCDLRNPAGGTGKGVIVNGVKKVRYTTKIDGKSYRSDDKFKFSKVCPSTQVLWIDETNPQFRFDDLFSCLTDGWEIERKFKNKFDIPPKDSPKVVICSNKILDNSGTSNKRRQFVIEISDYYSKKIIVGNEQPIEAEHGILFENWSNLEWNKFYSFMLECLMCYFENGLFACCTKNIQQNLLKQKTCDEFIEFITSELSINEPIDIKMKFQSYKNFYCSDDSRFMQRKFTNWIKLYADSIQCDFIRVSKSNTCQFYMLKPKVKEQGNNNIKIEGGE